MKPTVSRACVALAFVALLTACDKKITESPDGSAEATPPADGSYAEMLRNGLGSDAETAEIVYATPTVTEISVVDNVPGEILEEEEKSEVRTVDNYEDAQRESNRTLARTKFENDRSETSQPMIDDGPVSMAVVEEKPRFPGGEAAMMRWISENINYPADAAEAGISGKVTVQFVVERDGSVSNIKVARGKDPSLDAEAVRVVKRMPEWIPGKNNGSPVRVTYLLPVTFRLAASQ